MARNPWRRSTRTAARVMVASAKPLFISSSGGESVKLGKQPEWQDRAMFYMRSIGEVWYAAQFEARSLTKLRLMVQELGDDGEWRESTDAGAIGVLRRLGDSDALGTLLGNYGRLDFVQGESILLCTMQKLDTGELVERWEVVSRSEVKRGDRDNEWVRASTRSAKTDEKIVLRDPAPGAIALAEDEALVYRLWRPDPEYSEEADSPMRAVLDIAEELLLLSQAVRARATSRLSGAGILIIPDEITFSAPDGSQSGSDIDGTDYFTSKLGEHMVEPIGDPGSASAVVPIVVRASGDQADRIRHLRVGEPSDTYPEEGLRREAIRRLATGLDMPPEILTGVGATNHWSAWQISNDAWTSHVQPVAERLVGELTSVVLRPFIRAGAAGEGVDANRFRVYYDAAELVVKPDRSKDAKDLHDRYVVSDSTLRDAAGFTDSDAPSPEEVAARVARLAPGPDVDPVTDGAGPVDVEEGPPATPEAIAASLVVARAREAAGARIRTAMTKRRHGLLPAIAETANGDVAARVGRGIIEDELGLNPVELVSGSGSAFCDALRQTGVSEHDALMLVRLAETSAAQTLYAVP